jgi:hypothetical protein
MIERWSLSLPPARVSGRRAGVPRHSPCPFRHAAAPHATATATATTTTTPPALRREATRRDATHTAWIHPAGMNTVCCCVAWTLKTPSSTGPPGLCTRRSGVGE